MCHYCHNNHNVSYWRASGISETALGVININLGICSIYICMYGWIVRMPLKGARGALFSPITQLLMLDPDLSTLTHFA